MDNPKRFGLIFLVALLLSLFGINRLFPANDALADSAKSAEDFEQSRIQRLEGTSSGKLRRVRTAEVRSIAAAKSLKLSGITRAQRSATLAFTLSGRLIERRVELGDAVKAGEVLAKIDRRPFRFALQQADASLRSVQVQLEQARREETRLQRLRKADSVAEVELERATNKVEVLLANLDVAKSQRADLKRQLEEGALRAPFAGRISEVFVDPGEVLSPGRAVLAMESTGVFEVEVELPEGIASTLQNNEPVRVRFPFLGGREVPGRIRAIGYGSARPGRLFPVRIELEAQEGLKPGLTAEVFFGDSSQDSNLNQSNKLAVPVGALVYRGTANPSLFKVEKGVVRRMEVVAGGVRDSWVMVKTIADEGELKAGDPIVSGGQIGLVDGMSVEPVLEISGSSGAAR